MRPSPTPDAGRSGAAADTRTALLEQGALLFARHGVGSVTTRQLHEAVGARNESALHYHFGDKDGLVAEIIRGHVFGVEERRSLLVAAIKADDRSRDVRALVHAFAAPMAENLSTELGRAHLRLLAQLSNPSLAYGRQFRLVDAPAGNTLARWMQAALTPLPPAIRVERAAALRFQLISLFGLRAQLLDERASAEAAAASPSPSPSDDENELFLENLLDMLVAGLVAKPSTRASSLARA